MQTNPPTSPWMRRVGIVLTVLPSLLLLMSAGMKLSQQQEIVDGFQHMGFPPGVAVPIGAVELLATILFLVPQTAVLGAILLTGYLGGATVTHVRLDEPFISPVLVGVTVWLALYLRDERVRALAPLRR